MRQWSGRAHCAALVVALFVISSFVAVVSHEPSAAATTSTFTAVADAAVSKGTPTKRYGSATYLRARGGSSLWRSYLRFSVSGFSGPVGSVKLQLRVTKASNAGVTVRARPTSAWAESTVTFKNAPSVPKTTAGWLSAVTVGATTELDVTNLVTGNGVYEFVLTTTGADVQFSSREGAFAPRLVVAAKPETTTSTSPPTTLPPSGGALHFDDVTSSSGVAAIADGGYVHSAAWGDANGDRRLDLYLGTFTHKLTVPKTSRLLLATDSGFVDAGQAPLMTAASRVSGSVFADLDNDGDDDLVVANNRIVNALGGSGIGKGEPNHLYRNDNGVFVDVSEASGIRVADRNSRAVGVLDYDGDGQLDLLIVADSLTGTGTRVTRLLRNTGGLAFVDSTAASGLPTNLAGLGVAVGDATGDGWPDLALSGGISGSGSYANVLLFVNNADGTFRAPPGPDLSWAAQNANDWTSGAAWGDLNRDGRLDLVVGNHFDTADNGYPVAPRIWLNQGNDAGGNPVLTELVASGVAPLPFKSPHVEIRDLDNDSWPDLLSSLVVDTPHGPQPVAWRSAGAGATPAFETPEVATISYYGPGAPTADYDQDGRIDVLVEGLDAATGTAPHLLLLRNATDTSNHWLEVMVSTPSNRSGFGAQVRVYRAGHLGEAAALLGLAEVNTGNGFSSGASRVLHFGLGGATEVDLEVALPFGGPVLTRHAITADQVVTVTPG